MVTRRHALARSALAAAALLAGLPTPGARAASRLASRPTPRAARRVVLYSSVDDHLLRPVVNAFTDQMGIDVALAGDTEATKTTGLVQRLIDERPRPRADVWWSNEALGTMRLAREHVLEPLDIPWGERDRPGFKEACRGPDGLWWMVSLRRRALAQHEKIDELAPANAADPAHAAAPPRGGVDALLRPELKGRVGLARPHFGTTRGQLGALLATRGEDRFRAWLDALKANRVRVYDGNSAVVRAIAQGEILLGLTDTDDIAEAQKQSWPVRAAPAQPPAQPTAQPEAAQSESAWPDAMEIPSTVARVRGGTNPGAAQHLISWLVSARVETMLRELNAGHEPLAAAAPALADRLDRAEASSARALELWDQVVGS